MGILTKIAKFVGVGPRGGRFYVSKGGKKVYGAPPKGRGKKNAPVIKAKSAQKPAPKKKAPAKRKAAPVAKKRVPAKKPPVKKTLPKKPVVAQKAPPKAKPKAAPVPVKKPLGRPKPFTPAQKAAMRAQIDAQQAAAYKAPAAARLKASSTHGYEQAKHAPMLKGHPGNTPENAARWDHAVKMGGYEKLLAQHPLSHMMFADGRRVGANGACLMVAQRHKPYIHIAENPMGTRLDHKMAAHGERVVVPNVIRPKGLSGKKDDFTADWQAGTIIHELGHHMHGHLIHNKFDHETNRRIMNAHSRARASRSAVSLYALTNKEEWFAETHLAYVVYKSELQSKRPDDYAVIRDARIAAGLDP